MRRCPVCGRTYYDDMLYCLEDGNELVENNDPADALTVVDAEVWAPTSNLPHTEVLYTPPFSTTTHSNSIAVLPFVNMSADAENEYFCDGLAEELLNVLSKIEGLRVAARTSAFSFKNKQTTITEIARALNVASILEGSIRLVGKRIRISVQLVSPADGYQIWSESYDRLMDDIFAIQDDIAQSVVAELKPRLPGAELDSEGNRRVVSEVAAAAAGRADDPEAQRLMFLGRAFLDRLTREDTAKGIEYFQSALEIDPEYALCWAELGRAYSIEAGRAWVDVAKGFELSREAAKKALAIEPDLAEGHAQLGRIQLTHDFDFEGGEASYRRARELAPGSSPVMDGAAVLAYKLGRFDEALKLARRVLVQDPLSAAFWHNLGLVCHAAGRLEESEQAFLKALELVPQRLVSNALLALVKLDQGNAVAAVEQAEKEPYEMWRLWALAIIDHVSGNKAGSDAHVAALIENHAEGNAYQIAEVMAMRGETDEAFKWLEESFENRDPGITHSMVNPRLRALNNDPRWKPLLSRIGFEI